MAEHEKITMAQALNQALRDAMTADESVLVFGEDVGALGGVFRVTDGLTAEFGDARCFDTPLAESGIMGMAVGLAMNGMRPVVEMQFDAFAYPGVRADRQPRRQDAQPHPRRRRAADHDPHPVRRRHRRRRAPLRLVGGLLRAHAGPDGRGAGDRRGRVHADARGDRVARSGRRAGAQEALLEQGRGRPRRGPARHRPRGRTPGGHRRDPHRVRHLGADRARGGGRRGGGGSQPAGRRRPVARAVRRRDGVRGRTLDRPRRRDRRGGRVRERLVRDRRPGHRALLPPPRRAGPPGHRVRHPLPAAQARAPPPARASTASSTPSTTSSGTTYDRADVHAAGPRGGADRGRDRALARRRRRRGRRRPARRRGRDRQVDRRGPFAVRRPGQRAARRGGWHGRRRQPADLGRAGVGAGRGRRRGVPRGGAGRFGQRADRLRHAGGCRQRSPPPAPDAPPRCRARRAAGRACPGCHRRWCAGWPGRPASRSSASPAPASTGSSPAATSRPRSTRPPRRPRRPVATATARGSRSRSASR